MNATSGAEINGVVATCKKKMQTRSLSDSSSHLDIGCFCISGNFLGEEVVLPPLQARLLLGYLPAIYMVKVVCHGFWGCPSATKLIRVFEFA